MNRLVTDGERLRADAAGDGRAPARIDDVRPGHRRLVGKRPGRRLRKFRLPAPPPMGEEVLPGRGRGRVDASFAPRLRGIDSETLEARDACVDDRLLEGARQLREVGKADPALGTGERP